MKEFTLPLTEQELKFIYDCINAVQIQGRPAAEMLINLSNKIEKTVTNENNKDK